jgi:hypothetical protein
MISRRSLFPALLLLRPNGRAETSGPGPRNADQMLVYEEHARRVLLFGGSGQNVTQGGLWSWDGRNWTLLSEQGPGPRDSGVMWYDPRRKRTVLFGGRDRESRQLGETWEWDGMRWSQAGSDGPLIRLHSAAAYDERRGVGVVCGPRFAPKSMPRPLPAETWLSDENRWRAGAATGPADCLMVGMAYDPASKSVVLIVAKLPAATSKAPWGATEQWHWAGRQWLKFSGPTPPAEPGRWNVVRTNTGLLLLDGLHSNGVRWRWDGRTWTEINMAGPTRRSSHVMAWDRERKRVVLYGGTLVEGELRQRLSDTWEFDLESWTRVR